MAVLGSDSAIGKRTTAWIMTGAFQQAGFKSEIIGTGQTAWLPGAKFGVILDSLINDFVSGEIEHAVWSAWDKQKPQVMFIEGQGSLMNPAYPGGFEILAAARPHVIICSVMEKTLGIPVFDVLLDGASGIVPGYILHRMIGISLKE